MSGVFRRCGCRDDQGKTYGVLPEQATDAQRAKACPKMIDDPKHGRWGFRLSAGFDPATGKRRQVNGGTYPTKREAQQARNAMAVKIDQGKLVTPSRQTFGEYLPQWLERRQRTTVRGKRPLAPASAENYQRYIENDIAPSALGAMKLQDIRRRHIQSFVDQLVDGGRGAVTIRRIIAVVQGALTSALREELIEDNPARDLDLPHVDQKEVTPWEPAQVGHFLDVATQHRLGALFEVAMFTGLRRGELIGLRWSTDVDLERRELWVQNNRTKAGDGDTKTKAGRRRVALDDQAVGALIGWQIAQQAERAAFEDSGMPWQDTGYVFTMEDGRPLKPQYATRLFDTLRAKAGLPKVADEGGKAYTFHGQRHQAASLLLASGADLTTVQKRLGHSSGAVTSDIYSHLLRSRDHDVANQAAALVPRSVHTAPVDKAGAHTLHAQGGENETEAAPAEAGNGL